MHSPQPPTTALWPVPGAIGAHDPPPGQTRNQPTEKATKKGAAFTTPLKSNGWNMSSRRFFEDHVPF